MTPDEHAELTRLCNAMTSEHDLTKALGIVQQLNAFLDGALVRKMEAPELDGERQGTQAGRDYPRT